MWDFSHRRKPWGPKARKGVLRIDTKNMIHKSKNWQTGPHQKVKLLLSKKNFKEDEKTNYTWGENICKQHIQQRTGFYTI